MREVKEEERGRTERGKGCVCVCVCVCVWREGVQAHITHLRGLHSVVARSSSAVSLISTELLSPSTTTARWFDGERGGTTSSILSSLSHFLPRQTLNTHTHTHSNKQSDKGYRKMKMKINKRVRGRSEY